MSNKMNIENVCSFMEEALNSQSTQLQQKCQEVFSKETKEIMDHASFLCLSQHALSTFLDTEEINVLEIILFNLVCKWMREKCNEKKLDINGANMRTMIGDAIIKIRFPTMTSFDFANHVVSIEGLLTDSEIATLFKMITMSDNSKIDCPFPAKHRCRNSKQPAYLSDAKLLYSNARLEHPGAGTSSVVNLLEYIKRASNASQLTPSSLLLALQCCENLANSPQFSVLADDENHKLRTEIYEDICHLTTTIGKNNLSDIWTQFGALKTKLGTLLSLMK